MVPAFAGTTQSYRRRRTHPTQSCIAFTGALSGLDQCPMTPEGIGNDCDNLRLTGFCKFAAGLPCGVSNTIRIFDTQHDRDKPGSQFLGD